MTWTKLADDRVSHHWQCPDCNADADIAPGWYQDNGTPMCAECEQNMDYQHTEIKND